MNNYHTFVLNANSEERRQVLLPLIENAIESGESFVAINSDGKLIDYLASTLKSHDYIVHYLDFSNANADWQWNPLQYPYLLYKNGQVDNCVEQINMLAAAIMGKDSHFNSQDPFWANSAADLFVALVLSIFENASSQEVNLFSVLDMVVEGTKKYTSSSYIHEYFSLEQCKNHYKLAATYLNSPPDTRGSIGAVFIQGLRNILGSDLFCRHMLVDTINLQRIPRDKTAIIINISENSSYMTLVGILITQINFALIRESKKFDSNRIKSCKPFKFFLDKFLSIGRIPQIERVVSYSVDFQINYIFFVDNIAMLENVYDAEIGEVLREYCNKWIVFPTRNKKILAELNAILETYAREHQEKIIGVLKRNKPIVLDEHQTIAPYAMSEELPFEYQSCERKSNHYLLKEPQIFSIQDFVKEKKKENMASILENEEPRHKILQQPPIDIDKLVRKIDLKIAELEAEEKLRSSMKPDS